MAENTAFYDRVRDLYAFRSIGRVFRESDVVAARRIPMLMNYLTQDRFRNVASS